MGEQTSHVKLESLPYISMAISRHSAGEASIAALSEIDCLSFRRVEKGVKGISPALASPLYLFLFAPLPSESAGTIEHSHNSNFRMPDEAKGHFEITLHVFLRLPLRSLDE